MRDVRSPVDYYYHEFSEAHGQHEATKRRFYVTFDQDEHYNTRLFRPYDQEKFLWRDSIRDQV